jgi:ribose transport system substrate-binding protein
VDVANSSAPDPTTLVIRLTQPVSFFQKVAVFTNDVTPESTDAIRAGKLIAETHHGFPEWGWFGTQTAVQLACGQQVPKTQDIRPRTVYEGNADQFYPQPKLPAIDWAKIKADCGGEGN